MTRMIQTIREILDGAGRILVATHIRPDGDALGSLLAMGLALESLGKEVVLYNESPVPAGYRFLPGVERITGDAGDLSGFDCAVILDCGDEDRLGKLAIPSRDIPVRINIDHHGTNPGFGTHNLVEPEASATAEILYRLFRKMGVVITPEIACGIYTGIFTDTGSLRFSNATHQAFSICTEMVALGVKPGDVARHVYGTHSLGRIRLLNRVLDSIEVSDNGRLSIMTLTQEMFQETGADASDVTGLVNYAKHIEDVEVAALIQEADPEEQAEGAFRYHVSLRSEGRIDVSRIAARFGGGGHPAAAGFSTAKSPAAIRELLHAETRDLLPPTSV